MRAGRAGAVRLTRAPDRSPPVVFLDRDGTINRKAPEGEYVRSWAEWEYLPGALDALARMSRAGLRLVVVTNQRGIALGHMGQADVEDIHARLSADVVAAGGRLEGIYCCPHEQGTCDCRKPGVGLFLRAAAELAPLDLETATVVGDSESDMEAGERLGLTTVLVAPSGAGRSGAAARADHATASLADAADWLLGGRGAPRCSA